MSRDMNNSVLRRGSLMAAVGLMKKTADMKKSRDGSGTGGKDKESHSKDGSIRLVLELSDLAKPREGDFYYRTVRIYPRITTRPEEYFILISRAEPAQSPAPTRKEKRTPDLESRKLTTMREDTMTPPVEETPHHQRLNGPLGTRFIAFFSVSSSHLNLST